jgi:hypothetical protein
MLDGTGAISTPRIAAGQGRTSPRLRALIGLAAVLAALAGTWWAASNTTPDPGPLAFTEPEGGWSGGPVLRGQWAVTTLYTNRLAGVVPAVIDSVSPATPPRFPGLVLRYGAVSSNHGGWGFGRGWPPGHTRILPLRGAVVRPGHPAAILVGATARTAGRWRVTAFTVRYHVGRAHYVATFEQGIEIRVRARCRSCTGHGELAGRLAG